MEAVHDWPGIDQCEHILEPTSIDTYSLLEPR